ncbi:MAG TPA: SRPBCC family protein [Candidatus Solibacter sp.]|nr:SRPBCC family protein [Candidatus Solibacter sp.]
MKERHVIAASAEMRGDARRVYEILADYKEGHPRILPPQFQRLQVERGGYGEGTVIRVEMKLLGAIRTYRAAVSEPAPGRVLVEADVERDGPVTTFTVERLPGSGWARVKIETIVQVRGGLLGRFERWIATRTLRPIYDRELEMLSAAVA